MRHLALAAAVLAAFTLPAHAGKTLDAIKERGQLVCGTNPGLPGFAAADSKGVWSGLDVDICKALAASILGDANKVKWVPLNASQRFTALQSGEIDVLSRNTTWTLTRDASLGLLYAGVYFYDGQGFLVPKSLGLKNALELDGASICTATGTTSELNMADYFRANGKTFKPVVFESQQEARAAFFSGRCQAFSADTSYLSSVRVSDAPNPDDWQILPQLISKEPLGPVVGRNDLDFFTVAKWTLMALIEAEEKGVTSANVDAMKDSKDPGIQRLLGTSGDMGQKLGLSADWAYQIIKRVGNYGEIFERNVGPKTPLRLERGANALWSNGGLMYSMPIR